MVCTSCKTTTRTVEEKTNEDNLSLDAIPFTVVDQVPVFPGCEDVENQRECFIQKMKKHVALNLDTSIKNGLSLIPGEIRVYVKFKIDKTGHVVDVKSRGPHKKLEEEAMRVIRILPQMQPGIHHDKKVYVIDFLPIIFVVD